MSKTMIDGVEHEWKLRTYANKEAHVGPIWGLYVDGLLMATYAVIEGHYMVFRHNGKTVPIEAFEVSNKYWAVHYCHKIAQGEMNKIITIVDGK